jgi:hypothetical protein
MNKPMERRRVERVNTGTAPQRLDEVLKVVKMELVSGSTAVHERGRGFNPYDGRLGRDSRDVWGRRRRS